MQTDEDADGRHHTDVNHQSGVLIGENLAARSLPNCATSYDRGTSPMWGDKRVADAMLLEDSDPDGDIAWFYHVWWYGAGPGRYRLIGGTGKWEGITSEGRTLGILRSRKEEHWVLRTEVFWSINQEERREWRNTSIP